MSDHPVTRARRLRAVAKCIGVAVGLLAVYGCSLIVSTNSSQCQTSSDCAMYAPGATCDPVKLICVAPAAGSSSTSASSGTSGSSSSGGCNVDGGIDGGGCYACAATDNATLLNECTTGCIDFNNDRVKGLLAGGALPSLPNPGPDGGM